jgi:serine/threonine-protein kinase
MAPEQACGKREEIDSRTDQFSLAAIAYTLLTGHEPFQADDPIAILYQVVHADPPPPAALLPRLGPAVDAVIMRGLAKHSDDRFPDVTSFVGALRQAIEPAPAELLRPEEVEDEPPPMRIVESYPPRRARPQDPPVGEAGRKTRRLIRRMRWSLYRVPRRVALLAVAAAASVAWLSPTARDTAETMWRHAQVQAEHLLSPRRLH